MASHEVAGGKNGEVRVESGKGANGGGKRQEEGPESDHTRRQDVINAVAQKQAALLEEMQALLTAREKQNQQLQEQALQLQEFANQIHVHGLSYLSKHVPGTPGLPEASKPQQHVPDLEVQKSGKKLPVIRAPFTGTAGGTQLMMGSSLLGASGDAFGSGSQMQLQKTGPILDLQQQELWGRCATRSGDISTIMDNQWTLPRDHLMPREDLLQQGGVGQGQSGWARGSDMPMPMFYGGDLLEMTNGLLGTAVVPSLGDDFGRRGYGGMGEGLAGSEPSLRRMVSLPTNALRKPEAAAGLQVPERSLSAPLPNLVSGGYLEELLTDQELADCGAGLGYSDLAGMGLDRGSVQGGPHMMQHQHQHMFQNYLQSEALPGNEADMMNSFRSMPMGMDGVGGGMCGLLGLGLDSAQGAMEGSDGTDGNMMTDGGSSKLYELMGEFGALLGTDACC
eukprot:TRINITY_DN662_c0_g3_i1.p1 TRINITY_DN662_c0_g3~~TRINITY_DN662_c0_g3_i1.p1  ORF type:complete len:510 (+),score=87.44 TRINITY_DN662_c0_g3_i1:181-1530(+)